MYLHIGGNYVIPYKDLIAIFDLEKLKKQEATREFLKFSKEDSCIINISAKKQSVVLTQKYLYYSPISSSTLLKRAQQKQLQKK